VETGIRTFLVDELGWHSNCFDRLQDTEVTTTAPSAPCAGQGTTGFDGQCRPGKDSTQRVAIEVNVAHIAVLTIATRLYVAATHGLEGSGQHYHAQRGGASCSRGRVARLQSSADRSSSEQRRLLVKPVHGSGQLYPAQRGGASCSHGRVARLQSSAGCLSTRYLARASADRSSLEQRRSFVQPVPGSGQPYPAPCGGASDRFGHNKECKYESGPFCNSSTFLLSIVGRSPIDGHSYYSSQYELYETRCLLCDDPFSSRANP
jgi:hypothetical protein